MTYDRSIISAYVDGELNLVAAKRLEKAISSDPELAQAIAHERALRTRLARHFDPVLDEKVPDALSALLSGKIEGLPTPRAASTVTSFRPSWPQWAARAASLVIGVIGGMALNQETGYVRDQQGQIIASGDLADALNTQLASTQSRNAAVRIGTSFAAKEGGFCRTFESAALDGIACTDGADWKLQHMMAGDKSAQYRQASAGTLAEAAAAMMAGEPLDAPGEAAAKKRGWR